MLNSLKQKDTIKDYNSIKIINKVPVLFFPIHRFFLNNFDNKLFLTGQKTKLDKDPEPDKNPDPTLDP